MVQSPLFREVIILSTKIIVDMYGGTQIYIHITVCASLGSIGVFGTWFAQIIWKMQVN